MTSQRVLASKLSNNTPGVVFDSPFKTALFTSPCKLAIGHFDQVLLLKAVNIGLSILDIMQADPQDLLLVVHADICRHKADYFTFLFSFLPTLTAMTATGDFLRSAFITL